MDPILELRSVSKHYPGFSLRDVSFSIPRGYVCALIGPNGAGKTTIVKMILGLVRPEGGALRVCGNDPVTAERAVGGADAALAFVSARLPGGTVPGCDRSAPARG